MDITHSRSMDWRVAMIRQRQPDESSLFCCQSTPCVICRPKHALRVVPRPTTSTHVHSLVQHHRCRNVVLCVAVETQEASGNHAMGFSHHATPAKSSIKSVLFCSFWTAGIEIEFFLHRCACDECVRVTHGPCGALPLARLPFSKEIDSLFKGHRYLHDISCQVSLRVVADLQASQQLAIELRARVCRPNSAESAMHRSSHDVWPFSRVDRPFFLS